VNAADPLETNVRDIERAKHLVAIGDSSLQRFSLAYCKGNYLSPASMFLSYMKWDTSYVIKIIKQTKIPILVISGSSDRDFGGAWPIILRSSGIPVKIINDADHFFSSPLELDFHDALLAYIK
jgi:hypothetical protein